MIFLVNAENRGQFAMDLQDMYGQRKIVLAERADWAIPVLGYSEVDGYDREETMYLLAKAQPEGQVLASARLLPTTGPHLVSDLFAAACRDTPPRGATVWEVSRFCTSPELHGRGPRLGLLWELICGVMEAGLLYGIDQVVFAANRVLSSLALNCGWEARTLGPGLREGEDEVTAMAAKITQGGLSSVRRRHGVRAPVTRLLAATPPSASSPLLRGCSLKSVPEVPYAATPLGRFRYYWRSPGTDTR